MFEHVKKLHLIGANGVGVSAVGKLFLTWGKKVSGSDIHGGLFSEELEKLGAVMNPSPEGVNEMLRPPVPSVVPPMNPSPEPVNGLGDVDLVVYSSAVPETNPERLRATELGITQMSLAEFLGELAKGYTTIAVTGTHGKSTTTAMIGKMLEDLGLDPTVIVGSRVPGWELGNIRVSNIKYQISNKTNDKGMTKGQISNGEKPYLVIEACEHMAHQLKISPDIGVITNVEFDHPDFYRDLAHVKEVMRTWEAQCGQVVRVEEEPEPNLHLKVPGHYNERNAAGALAVARLLNLDEETTRASLEAFTGIWRRFEHLGEWRGADVYSDYGHHPTAIRETIKAVRDLFPGRRLVHIFQPHQHARTAELFDEFVDVLGEADLTILVEIYGVAGRTPLRSFGATEGQTDEKNVSIQDLVTAVENRRSGIFCHGAKSLEQAEELVRELVKPGDILFFQGAGDIDDVARKLVS